MTVAAFRHDHDVVELLSDVRDHDGIIHHDGVEEVGHKNEVQLLSGISHHECFSRCGNGTFFLSEKTRQYFACSTHISIVSFILIQFEIGQSTSVSAEHSATAVTLEASTSNDHIQSESVFQ